MKYREYKCPTCSWVHAAIPLSDAEAQVANEYFQSQGRPQTDHYFRCFKCGAPTDGFVRAGPAHLKLSTCTHSQRLESKLSTTNTPTHRHSELPQQRRG